FSEAELLDWLTSCRGLTNLRLRHCCQLSACAVSRLAAACASLEVLMLDRCDLPTCGFKLEPVPYGALSYVMIARCKSDDAGLPRGCQGSRHAAGVIGDGILSGTAGDTRGCLGGDVGAGGGEVGDGGGGRRSCWWMPLERDVKIIRLCDGAVLKEAMYQL
ncbi:hypothetical protein VaNZ11_008363, partial [Volvox africanus]